MVPSPRQYAVGACKRITFLIFYHIRPRVVTFLTIIDAPIQGPRIFYITFSFMSLNFRFQILLLFVSAMYANTTSYIVQIIYIALAWVLYPLHFSLFPFI